MSSVELTIDGQTIEVSEGTTILAAARKAGLFIPGICAHPDPPPATRVWALFRPPVFNGLFILN